MLRSSSTRHQYGDDAFAPAITKAFQQEMTNDSNIPPVHVIIHENDVPAGFELEQNILDLMQGEMTIGDGYTIVVSVERWAINPLQAGEFRFILGSIPGQENLE